MLIYLIKKIKKILKKMKKYYKVFLKVTDIHNVRVEQTLNRIIARKRYYKFINGSNATSTCSKDATLYSRRNLLW